MKVQEGEGSDLFNSMQIVLDMFTRSRGHLPFFLHIGGMELHYILYFLNITAFDDEHKESEVFGTTFLISIIELGIFVRTNL